MDPQTITAISAVVIALAALFLTVWQAIMTRRHNRLSVKPHLGFDRIVDGNPVQASLVLRNTGVGPAIIKRFAVFLKGKEVTPFSLKSWYATVEAVGLSFAHITSQILDVDQGIAASDSRNILVIDRPGPGKTEAICEALYGINIKIDYESVYGEQFYIELNSDL